MTIAVQTKQATVYFLNSMHRGKQEFTITGHYYASVLFVNNLVQSICLKRYSYMHYVTDRNH